MPPGASHQACIERIELRCPNTLFGRLSRSPLREQLVREHVAEIGIARVQLKRPAEMVFGLDPIPIVVKKDYSQRTVRLC